jgi:hypothetical protein
MLFDITQRTDSRPAQYSEPRFTFLNRSARPGAEDVRSLMETWFAKYPQAHQAQLKRRLRSADNRDFDSAFLELYLHELACRLGYSVEVHRRATDDSLRTPDFLLTSPDGQLSYLEAIVATNLSQEERGAASRANEVYDAINEIESPNFFLWLQVRGSPSTAVPRRNLKRTLTAFLRSQDPDECHRLFKEGGLDHLPRLSFSHGGWEIDFFPIAKSPRLRGKPGVRPIGAQLFEAEMVDDRSAIRDAIVEKATRYGNLGQPYVIAVNAVTQLLDNIDIGEALFGKETFVFRRDDATSSGKAEPELRRLGDGAWTSPLGSRYTRVSAVLIVSSLAPWTVADAQPRLYHNPWAKRPCTTELTRLPQAIPNSGRIEHRDGVPTAELFELRAGWPRSPPA